MNCEFLVKILGIFMKLFPAIRCNLLLAKKASKRIFTTIGASLTFG